MEAAHVTTFDEMAEHLAELLSCSHSLAHAMCDDGCDCETTLVRNERNGRVDYEATDDRDRPFREAAQTNYNWGIHNPNTRWGNDVVWPAQTLKGTPHEVLELDGIDAPAHWPHPPLAEVCVSDAELDLAHQIDDAERTIAAALRIHINPATLSWREAYDTDECRALRRLAEYGSSCD